MIINFGDFTDCDSWVNVLYRLRGLTVTVHTPGKNNEVTGEIMDTYIGGASDYASVELRQENDCDIWVNLDKDTVVTYL